MEHLQLYFKILVLFFHLIKYWNMNLHVNIVLTILMKYTPTIALNNKPLRVMKVL